MIALSGVGYRPPGGEAVLHDVTLSLAPGELVALSGPSGSGKTTLVRLLNGLALPTCGRVEVDGLLSADAEARQAIRGRVGVVLGEVDNQLLVGSVEEEVAFGPAGQGLPGDEVARRVESALAEVGLLDKAEEDPLALPMLDKYRLLVAAMLAQGVAYLAIDGVAALAPGGREELLSLLARLSQSRGLGVLVAGPRRADLPRFQRVIGLAEGAVAYDGPPQAVMNDDSLACRLGLFLPPPVSLAPVGDDVSAPVLLVEGMEAFAGRTFAVARGEVAGLACDPALLARLGEALAGLDKDETGLTVSLEGRRVTADERRKAIALVRGDRSQALGRTVWEDVNYGLGAGAEERAAAALALAGLGGPAWRARSPHGLSAGERNRLAIAAALARQPRAIVLVEPFLGLDETSAAELTGALAAWCREAGAAALVISARVDELSSLLARVEPC